ncbi:aspartate aminotransferase family protein [Ornithinimicrobium sp. W1665]|uniref:aspartate aminotransferase family protein n=1 Tax=Ornithinimicrobium sp. W1665 TaxID=3416666 RepID=UPI003CEC72BB
MTANSAGLYDRDCEVIARIQHLRFFPAHAIEGNGTHLIDEDGRRVLDMSAAWGAATIGYSHPEVVAAVSSAVRSMPGASILSMTNPEAVSLAEELRSLVPGEEDRKVYLGHAASDANSAVIRSVRTATGRPRVVTFDGSYHGGLGDAEGVSGLYLSRAGADASAVAVVAYPSESIPGSSAAALTAVRTELGRGDVAAVIVEPLQCDGGVRVPPAGFLTALSDTCSAFGALLICDEAKVGLGRTGLLHAFQVDDVTPDIVTFGKGLGGGLPLSAAVGPASILDAAPASALLTTAGNPVAAAAGRAVLRVLLRDGLAARAQKQGERLARGLDELASRHSCITHIRGRGLVRGVEVSHRDGRPAGDTTAKVVFRAYQLGVIAYCVGAHGNVIELTPALIIADSDIDLALAVLDQAFADVERGLVSNAEVSAFTGW